MPEKNFSTEEINTGRQPEVDLAKFITMLFLPFIHIFILCSTEEGLSSGLPYIFDTVIGGPLGAPNFIFAMGIGLVYTNKNSLRQNICRAIQLFVVGFLFNIARFVIPYFFGWVLTGNREQFIEPMFWSFFRIDILQFAGMALFLTAFLLHFNVSNLLLLLIGFVFSICGTFVQGFDTGNTALNIFLGFFVGVEDKAGQMMNEFVLLNWFIVLVSGVVFGRLLRRIQNKNRFYGIITIPCLVFTFIYFFTGIKNLRGMFDLGENCYYFISTPDALASIIAILGLLGAYHFISKLFNEKIQFGIFACSCSLTNYYIIHWVLISWVISVFIFICRGTTVCSTVSASLLSLSILIISLVCAVSYKRLTRPYLFNRGIK